MCVWVLCKNDDEPTPLGRQAWKEKTERDPIIKMRIQKNLIEKTYHRLKSFCI